MIKSVIRSLILFLIVLILPGMAYSQSAISNKDSLSKAIDSTDSLFRINPVSAFKTLDKIDSLNSNPVDSNLAAKCSIQRAKLYFNRHLLVDAQTQLSKAENYLNSKTPYITSYNYYFNKALVTDRNLFGNKVLLYYYNCLYYAKKIKDNSYIVNTYLNIADLSTVIGLDKSKLYLDSASSIATKSSNPKLLLRVKTTLAFYYIRLKNYSIAKNYVDDVDSLVNNYSFKIDDRYNLGFTKAVVFAHFDLALSNKVLDSLEVLCKQNHYEAKIPQIYTLKVINYKELGDYKSAFLTSEKLIDLNDSISNRNFIDLELILKNKHESELKNLELASNIREFKYQRNLVIFLSVSIFIVLIVIILLIRQYAIKNKLLAQKEIDKLSINKLILKSEAIRNQMSPHFILNALNSLQNLIFEKDKFKVSDAITNIGKLTSIYLQDNFNEFVSVKQEVEQLKIYFQVEKLRIGDKAELEIILDPHIITDTYMIPALILQPLVENSIWHGIAPSESNCLIQVAFLDKGDSLEIIVSDDGVGLNYKNSFLSRDRASKGLDLIKSRLSIINQIHNLNCTFSIDENKDGKGTIAKIFFPKMH